MKAGKMKARKMKARKMKASIHSYLRAHSMDIVLAIAIR